MNTFIFKSYDFNKQQKKLSLTYSYDDEVDFTESYVFDFNFIDYSDDDLEKACDLLFFIAGISYYKAYLPINIEIKQGKVDEKTSQFLEQTYKKGLGELLYINKLPPNLEIHFPVNCDAIAQSSSARNGYLIAIGGGKDSIVSYELMKKQPNCNTWSVGHRSQLTPLVNILGSNHFWVERTIDKKIIELNNQPETYNGHIPISAIFAALGSVIAVLSGKRDIVVSNEQSANEATLEYVGTSINHQYSKTTEFETSFQQMLEQRFGESIRYYSLLRPLKELAICKTFSENHFETYKNVFSSCNRAFTQNSSQISWCGECSKCAAIALLFYPYLPKETLNVLFGKHMLADEKLVKTYKKLVGVFDEKPLECVGEIAESRFAMNVVKNHAQLFDDIKYESPKDDQIWAIFNHDIPADVWKQLDLERIFTHITESS